ncbi:hypothetical protein BDV25DRAFT_69940 [Aspergillus avenaceus]|uniref:Uncharacterized protein n=1 Tax=Aspergillus avenaceus TaxID=36643 RepID=A0A5N6U1B1_ASPAV|nr:hypothetical protein BDV25DRAFT_69940 [Aspergillus avenaceus]
MSSRVIGKLYSRDFLSCNCLAHTMSLVHYDRKLMHCLPMYSVAVISAGAPYVNLFLIRVQQYYCSKYTFQSCS